MTRHPEKALKLERWYTMTNELRTNDQVYHGDGDDEKVYRKGLIADDNCFFILS